MAVRIKCEAPGHNDRYGELQWKTDDKGVLRAHLEGDWRLVEVRRLHGQGEVTEQQYAACSDQCEAWVLNTHFISPADERWRATMRA